MYQQMRYAVHPPDYHVSRSVTDLYHSVYIHRRYGDLQCTMYQWMSVPVYVTRMARCSTYAAYKYAVCTACRATECKRTALFKGYIEINESTTIETARDLDNVTLKHIDKGSFERTPCLTHVLRVTFTRCPLVPITH